MDALLFGLSLGFVAGITPGPLMTLVMTATLERGFRAGMLTAVAPLLTDAPVILLSLVALRQLPAPFLPVVSVIGGLFIITLGVQTVLSAQKPREVGKIEGASGRDVLRGVAVNVLNPHPWIFWVGVGGPFLLRSWAEAHWHAAAFLASFFVLIVGTKIAIAWATAHGRRFLNAVWYQRILAGCGLLLIGLGALLAWQGLALAVSL